MSTYKISNRIYKGDYPVTVTVDENQVTSNEDGEIIDPAESVARLLEGMPEWERTEGPSAFDGPNEVSANTLRGI
jgi:hypothetical protein